MTVFFDQTSAECEAVARAFDFFADGNVDSFLDALNSDRADFSDEQIGFVLPSEPSEILVEFLGQKTLRSDYFFALLSTDSTFRSYKKIFDVFEKSGIKIKYLNFFPKDEGKRKRADRAILFRSEAGLFVEKIQEIPLKAKVSSIVSGFSSAFKKKEKSQTEE